MKSANPKSRYQFRTVDLFVLTTVAALGVLLAPLLREGPIGGTAFSSVVYIVSGGLLGTATYRLWSSAHAFRHQVIGAIFISLVGYYLASLRSAGGQTFREMGTLVVCVYAGGIVGAMLGGLVTSLFSVVAPQWDRVSRPHRKVALRAGFILLLLVAVLVGALTVFWDRAVRWNGLTSLLLMVIGGTLGAAVGRTSSQGRHLPLPLFGGLLFAVGGFYFAELASSLGLRLFDRAFVVISVYIGGVVGGLLGARISYLLTDKSLTSNRTRCVVRYCGWAVLGLVLLVAARRYAEVAECGRIVAALEARGAKVDYSAAGDVARHLSWLLDYQTFRYGRRHMDLQKYLGLKVVTRVNLLRESDDHMIAQRPRFPVDRQLYHAVDIDSVDSLEQVLSSVSELTIHADHLANRDFVTLYNSGGLSRVERLRIRGSSLDDYSFARLKLSQSIVSLDLSGTSVTDASVKRIATLTNLAHLDLAGTRVTNDSIDEIAKLDLKWGINVSETAITNEGVLRFKEQRPNCDVFSTLQLRVLTAGQINALDQPPPHTYARDAFTFTLDEPALLFFDLRHCDKGLRWTLKALERDSRVFIDDEDLQLSEASRILTLPAARYWLEVGSYSGTESYEFLLGILDELVKDISPLWGQLIETRLQPGSETDVFRIDAIPGETVLFESVAFDGLSAARARLIDSRGKQLFLSPLGTNAKASVDSEGSLFLLIQGAVGDTETRSVRFRLQRVKSGEAETTGVQHSFSDVHPHITWETNHGT